MKIPSPRLCVCALIILSCFGFFYALREKLSENYRTAAEELASSDRTPAALADFLFADVLGEKDRSVQLKLKRAQILSSEGDLSGAEKELAEALESEPENAEVFFRLGEVNHAAGEYAPAEQHYAKSFELAPQSETLVARVRNLVRSGEADAAQAILVSERGRFGSEAQFYLGLVALDASGELPPELAHLSDGKYLERIAVISSFVSAWQKESGDNADYVLVQQADLFNQIGETDFSLHDLDVVLGRNGEYRDAYLVQGQALLIDGNYAASIAALEKCLGLDVNNADAFFFLGENYDRLGDSSRAAEYRSRYKALLR